jgi:hypothetical protein
VHIPRRVNANIDANADGDTLTYAATDSHGDATNNATNSDSTVLLPIPIPYCNYNKWLSVDSSAGAVHGRARQAIINKLTILKYFEN